jgi:nicotinic acid mononucleotide adenylyltransferase
LDVFHRKGVDVNEQELRASANGRVPLIREYSIMDDSDVGAVASTNVRFFLEQDEGDKAEKFLHPGVYEYIRSNGLYAPKAPSPAPSPAPDATA